MPVAFGFASPSRCGRSAATPRGGDRSSGRRSGTKVALARDRVDLDDLVDVDERRDRRLVRALCDLEHGERQHRQPGADVVDVGPVAGDDALPLEPIDPRVHGAAGDADPRRDLGHGGVRCAPQGVEQSQIDGVEGPGHGVQRGPRTGEIKHISSGEESCWAI